MKRVKNLDEDKKRIHDMISAITILRFIGAIILSLFSLVTCLHYFFGILLTRDETKKKETKVCLENIFICVLPGSASRHVLRSYKTLDDWDATCSICLANFSETP